jgi:uncharacterized repeat protein (TIGR01451 family)
MKTKLLILGSILLLGIGFESRGIAQLQPAPTQPINTSIDNGKPIAQKVKLSLQAAKKVWKGKRVIYQPLSPQSSVKPGDTIRYTLVAKNISGKRIRNLVLTQPVPKGTVYILKSARSNPIARSIFSINGGKTYSSRPIVNKKPAPVKAYTHLRWQFDRLLGIRSLVTTSYEVKVD